MLSHFYGSITGYSNNRPLIGAALAVDYFFVLSGYVLTHQLENSRNSYSNHIRSRFYRLAPLNLLATFSVIFIVYYNSLSGGYVPQWYNGVAWEDVVANITLLTHTGFSTFDVINAPAWSISVEFLVSAFLLYQIVRHGSPTVALIIGALLAAYLMASGGNLRTDSSSGGILRGILGITLGYCAYHTPQKIFALRYSHIAGRAAFWISIFLIFKNSPQFDLLALLCFCISIAWLTASSKSLETSTLSCRAFKFLGDISFSIYLFHTPVLLLFAPGLIASAIGNAPAVLLLTSTTIILSAIVFLGFEKPTRAFLRP